MLKLSKLRRCHEASAFISAAASHLFLSEVHIAHDRAFMPFYPTCSQYAVEAIKKHGPFKGFVWQSGAFCAAIPGEVPDMIPFHEYSS